MCVEPTPALMLVPSGLQPMVYTRAPSDSKTLRAMDHEAPLAQSRPMRLPRSEYMPCEMRKPT